MASMVACGILLGGCAASSDEVTDQRNGGNDSLGIARFATEETANETVVRGFDSTGAEVARVDLVHGTFRVRATEDYPGLEQLSGRQLDIVIGGQNEFSWETAGFDPLMNMPAFAPSRWKVNALIADAHVKSLLDRWNIGFERITTLADETAYTQVQQTGNSAVKYANYAGSNNYGSVRGLNIGVCGGTNETAVQAIRLTGYDATYTSEQEYKIGQTCAATWSQKFCRFDTVGSECTVSSANDGILSQCGCGLKTQACKGCGSNATNGYASMNTTATGAQYCYGSSTDVKTLNLVVSSSFSDSGISVDNVPGAGCWGPNANCNIKTCTNASITLTAGGNYFDHWWEPGNITNYNQTYSVTMSSDRQSDALYSAPPGCMLNCTFYEEAGTPCGPDCTGTCDGAGGCFY